MHRLLLSLTLAVLLCGCGRPAQIGVDPSTFKTVDALYTAVSLRDPGLVDRTQAKLVELRASGKLPEDAGRSLDAIIAEAKGGAWESAQSRLGDLMRGQRR